MLDLGIVAFALALASCHLVALRFLHIEPCALGADCNGQQGTILGSIPAEHMEESAKLSTSLLEKKVSMLF